MKSGYIHVAFIIDESGSMYDSVDDVIGGFNNMVQEQCKQENGSCSISLYKFNDNVSKLYLGRPVEKVKKLCPSRGIIRGTGLQDLGYITNDFDNKYDSECVYSPGGCTAMNDAIGIAVTQIGEWLAGMPEEERPEKNLIVIMTDGAENASREYTLAKVKEMIKHQEEVYSWSFIYMGTDITNTKDADTLGIGLASYSSRDNFKDNYAAVSQMATNWRDYDENTDFSTKNFFFSDCAMETTNSITANYEKKLGKKIKS